LKTKRAFLDEVEEGETLVAIVLRDRDDEPQVALDHAALGLHVAALDALGELDLVRGGQERVPPDLAQEELEGVSCRLQALGEARRRARRLLRRRLLLRLLHLDPALFELLVQDLDVGRLELERLDRLGQISCFDEAGRFGPLEKLLNLFDLLDARAFLSHQFPCVAAPWTALSNADPGAVQKPPYQPDQECKPLVPGSRCVSPGKSGGRERRRACMSDSAPFS
jgi:hypothetical protein